MLLRIHQSGHLAKISDERKDLVKEALDYYKSIRQDIKNALPFWPLGLSKFSDSWVCLGLKAEDKIYLAVWRRKSSSDYIKIPVNYTDNKNVTVKCTYPSYEECEYSWNKNNKTLTVKLEKEFSARLFEIKLS